MNKFSALLIVPLLFLCAFSRRENPDSGWVKADKLKNKKDSFLLAPVSYYFPDDVLRDSDGDYYTISGRPLTASDTLGYPRSANITMNRTGDAPFHWTHEFVTVRQKANDTICVTIGLGDGEWFADYVIRIHDNYHKDGAEPGYPNAANDYKKGGIHFLTTKQTLQLDKKSYQIGDSIRGYMDDNFEIWSTVDHWKGYVNLKGTFKSKVLCDTCLQE